MQEILVQKEPAIYDFRANPVGGHSKRFFAAFFGRTKTLTNTGTYNGGPE